MAGEFPLTRADSEDVENVGSVADHEGRDRQALGRLPDFQNDPSLANR